MVLLLFLFLFFFLLLLAVAAGALPPMSASDVGGVFTRATVPSSCCCWGAALPPTPTPRTLLSASVALAIFSGVDGESGRECDEAVVVVVDAAASAAVAVSSAAASALFCLGLLDGFTTVVHSPFLEGPGIVARRTRGAREKVSRGKKKRKEEKMKKKKKSIFLFFKGL